MRFVSATLLIASLATSASAFSAVAPKSAVAKAGSVDKTLQSVDADANVFDPTSGENPALTRNNNDEVWVPQVCNATRTTYTTLHYDALHYTATPVAITNALLLSILYSELVLVATASPRLCVAWFGKT
jgi:hypothetical protein